MKFRTLIIILIISVSVLAFSACGPNGNSTVVNDPTETLEGTPGGGPEVFTTPAPDPADTAESFLGAWAEFNYEAMYAMLSSDTKAGFSYEDFYARYLHVEREATLTEVGFEILQSLTNTNDAQVAYRVSLYSGLAGEITRDTIMNLVMEDGVWKLVWDDSVILPELAGGNLLSMQRYTPIRGDILDRSGGIMAETNNFNAVVFSVIPSSIEEEEQAGFFQRLQSITGTPSGFFYGPLAGSEVDYTVKITELPEEIFTDREFYMNDYTDAYSYSVYLPQRFYYYDQAGAHALGYVGSIQAGDEVEWTRLGYPVDSLVGQMGIEVWAESYLAGKRGGDLFVISPDGSQRITILASQNLEPSKNVVTTLDADLQKWTQWALGDFTGAAVVMERDTGKILAIASSPSFDPNDADPNNIQNAWGSYFDGSTDSPFINRATQGQYPPGSIFKPITMAAALESGVFDTEDMLYCSYTWLGLDGITLYDWPWEKGMPESGNLNIQGALMRSCNPWFYEIGYQLYEEGYTQFIADTARDFGLGSETGVVGLFESSGNITNPDDMTGGGTGLANSVLQAIGQTDTVITPLQAAAYVAAIGNGGTLYTPLVIDRIEDYSGNIIEQFEPQVSGTLPVSQENLEIIQNAMWMVTKDPSGTASRLFQYFPLAVYGKTGTADNGSLIPHAWFIGYTDVQNENVPDIAIAVIVEFSGDGSEYAAPIFRRIVEAYFYGTPTRLYGWENQIGWVDPYYFTPEQACEDDPAGDDCKYHVDTVCADEPDGEDCATYTKIYEDAINEQE